MNLKIKRMRELAGFFAQTVRTDGFGPTLKRSAAFLKRRFGSKKGRFLPKKETLAAQRALDYGALGWPAVSICVPLYNTPQKYLRQLLDSVLGQTCPNWQLCLADASDAAHGDVAQTVRAYQARDARIRRWKTKVSRPTPTPPLRWPPGSTWPLPTTTTCWRLMRYTR